jgi:porin
MTFLAMKTRFILWLLFWAVVPLCAESNPGWKAGLEVSLETGKAWRDGAPLGPAWAASALAQLEWEQAKTNADGGVRFRGSLSVLALQGRRLTDRFLGDFLGASNIEGAAGTRWYASWLEGSAGAWSLRAGALLADEEFAGTEAGGAFLNSAFGWPAFISANTVNTGPAFYQAAPGLRVEFRSGESAVWRFGIYDGDSMDSRAGDPAVNRRGWRYRIGGEQGYFLIGELARAVGPVRLKLGSWLHTATFADVRRDAAGLPFADSGAAPRAYGRNYGAYAAAEYTLAGESGKAGAVEAFLRGGVAPRHRNVLAWSADGGVAWTGPIAGRGADVLALGVTHAAVSGPYAAHALAVAGPGPAMDFEQVVELSYRAVLTDYLSLVPDLQYLRHPGGSGAAREAWVMLLRADLRW